MRRIKRQKTRARRLLSVRAHLNIFNEGVKVTVCDPLAMENTRAVFGNRINYANSVKDCISQSRVCVITTSSDEFKRIDDGYLANSPTNIINCWRIRSKIIPNCERGFWVFF